MTGKSSLSKQMCRWAATLAVTLVAAVGVVHAETPAVSIIPAPQHVVMRHGTFTLRGGMAIAAPKDARAQWIAHFLRKHVQAASGVDLVLAGKDSGHAAVRLQISHALKSKNAYKLTIAPAGVTLVARDNRGLFWGVQTLRQLLPADAHGKAVLPTLEIEDAPHYRWRGVMLDVSRHFYPVSFIKRQIALMSYYKFDVFHWHLTDDQGWRIQIHRYPKLTSVGAWRTGADGKRHGGFYTRKQIREVVAYARKRNVMIVPEIEMPGHTEAAIAAYPKLSCTDARIAVPSTWGIFHHADCVARPGTYRFLENVLDEVVKLFPSPYVHIGGDEVPTGVWSQCVACQKLAKARELQGEAGLHSYFVHKIQRYLASKGKTLIGWSEIMQGGMDPDAIVEEWLGPKGTRKALDNGNRIIVAGPFYLSQAVSGMTLQDLYRNDPLTAPLYQRHARLVLGGEAALWSEAASPMNAAARLYPRLLAISEHLWNPDADNWPDFHRRVLAQEAWLASQGVAYGAADKDLIDYRLSYNPRFRRWRINAQRGFADSLVRYTHGAPPTAHSEAFSDVLDVYAPGTIVMAPFRAGRQLQRAEVFHFTGGIGLGKPVSYAVQPAQPYRRSLTDGISGDPYQKRGWQGTWARWKGHAEVAVVDLGHVMPIHKIATGYLGVASLRILLPDDVAFALSSDGKTWHTVYSTRLQPARDSGQRLYHTVSTDLHGGHFARYVRVTAQPREKSAWGDRAWLFSDVITIH